MLNKKLTGILLSGLLTLGTAPLAFPQAGQNSTQQSRMSPSQNQIKKAQQVLKDKGMYTGAVDGSMNGQFQKALRDYQNQNRLEATGRLDQPTMSKLGIMKGNPGNSNPGREKPSNVTPENNITPGKDLNKTPEKEQQQIHPEHQPDLNQSRTPNFDPATTGPSAEQSDNMMPGKVEHEYQQRATKAVEVVQSLTGSSDNRIPDNLLRRAEAIAVIPGMVKGAFGIGGTYGKGLVSERTKGGRWSAPAFITIGGGSFGFQLGANSTDLVLVFTDKAALNSLESGMSMKLGVNAGVTAGPIGREGEAGVSQNVQGGIFAYSRSKGLFAGIALNGDVLDFDKSANRKVYGESADANTILSSSRMASNVNVRPFVDELDRSTPMRRSTR